MANPPEKNLFIGAEQFKCMWKKASPARSNIGMLPVGDCGVGVFEVVLPDD